MVIIRKKEIANYSEKELKEKLKELKLERMRLLAQHGQATGNSKKIKEIKRTIARIHTQLNKQK